MTWGMTRPAGRPEELHVLTGDGALVGGVVGDLRGDLRGRHPVEHGVVGGVVAEGVTLGDLAADQVGILALVVADRAEGRLEAEPAEDVEHERCPVRAGAVVECERDDPAGIRHRGPGRDEGAAGNDLTAPAPGDDLVEPGCARQPHRALDVGQAGRQGRLHAHVDRLDARRTVCTRTGAGSSWSPIRRVDRRA